jgi:hypothetical protein
MITDFNTVNNNLGIGKHPATKLDAKGTVRSTVLRGSGASLKKFKRCWVNYCTTLETLPKLSPVQHRNFLCVRLGVLYPRDVKMNLFSRRVQKNSRNQRNRVSPLVAHSRNDLFRGERLLPGRG